MKNLKSGLCAAAFVFLICVFTPYYAHAQDDPTGDWPCYALNKAGVTIPWCNALTRGESLVSQSHYEFAQDIGQVPQFQNAFAGITRSTRGEIRHQYALFEGKRQEFALVRS